MTDFASDFEQENQPVYTKRRPDDDVPAHCAYCGKDFDENAAIPLDPDWNRVACSEVCKVRDIQARELQDEPTPFDLEVQNG